MLLSSSDMLRLLWRSLIRLCPGLQRPILKGLPALQDKGCQVLVYKPFSSCHPLPCGICNGRRPGGGAAGVNTPLKLSWRALPTRKMATQ